MFKSVIALLIIALAIAVPGVNGSNFNDSQRTEIVEIVKTAAANGETFWNEEQGQYVSDLGNMTVDNDENITELQANTHETGFTPATVDPQPVDQPVNSSTATSVEIELGEADLSGDSVTAMIEASKGGSFKLKAEKITAKKEGTYSNQTSSAPTSASNTVGSIAACRLWLLSEYTYTAGTVSTSMTNEEALNTYFLLPNSQSSLTNEITGEKMTAGEVYKVVYGRYPHQ